MGSLFRLITLLCAAVHCDALVAYEFVGKVAKVVDGETLVVADGAQRQYVRLAATAAPRKGQTYHLRSKRQLSSSAMGQFVRVEWYERSPNCTRLQRQRRLCPVLGKVLKGTVDLGLQQIRGGAAWYDARYRRNQSTTDRNLYELGELGAQRQRLGLWKSARPLPPWQFQARQIASLKANKKKARRSKK